MLPSGRTVEVISYEESAAALRELHICRVCLSPLVQVIQWAEAENGEMSLTLECPNCEWLEEGTYSREQIDALEDRLDEGLAEMISDLRRLSQANMADDVERFMAAVNADLILPEDF